MTMRFDSRRSNTSASNLNSMSSSAGSEPIYYSESTSQVQLYNDSVHNLRV